MIWFLPVTLLSLAGFATLGFSIIWLVKYALQLPKTSLRESNLVFGSLFFSIITGITVAVTVYACVVSGFKTINLIYFLLAGIFLFEARRNKWAGDFALAAERQNSSPRVPVLLGLSFLLVLCCVYAAGVYHFVSFGQFPVRVPYVDLVNYSNISQFLNISGLENNAVAFNLIDSSYHGTEPYHYYESWLNALLYRLWNIPHLAAMIMVTYPVFYLTLFIGLLAIWETFANVNFFALLLSFAMMFVGGVIYFSGTETLFDDTFIFYHRNIFVERKLGPLYVFAAAAILALRYNKFMLSVLFLLCMTVASTTPFPGIIGGVFLLFLLSKTTDFIPESELTNWYKENKQEVLRAFMYALAVAFLFFLFYYFTKDAKGLNIKRITSFSGIYNDFVSKGVLQRLVAYVKSTVFILFALLPYLLLIFTWLFKNKEQAFWLTNVKWPLLLLYGCITFACASAWAFLYFMLDSQQLSFNVLLPLSNLIICFVLIGIFSRLSIRKQPFWFLALFALLGYNMYLSHRIDSIYQYKKNYSDNYLQSIQKIVQTQNLSVIGACLLSPNEYKTLYNKNTWINTLGHYLYLMDNNISVISLNDFDLQLSTNPIERDIEEVNLAYGGFKRYVNRQKAAGDFASVAQSQADFIQQHGINFLITRQGEAISPELKAMIKESVADPISGEVFHLLQEKK